MILADALWVTRMNAGCVCVLVVVGVVVVVAVVVGGGDACLIASFSSESIIGFPSGIIR